MKESKQNQALSGTICTHNGIPQPFNHETNIFAGRIFCEFSCARPLILTDYLTNGSVHQMSQIVAFGVLFSLIRQLRLVELEAKDLWILISGLVSKLIEH